MPNSPYTVPKILYEYRLLANTEVFTHAVIVNPNSESLDEQNNLIYYTSITNQRLPSSMPTFETIYTNCGDNGSQSYGLLILRVVAIFPPSFTRCDTSGNDIFSGIIYVQDLNSNYEVLYINSTLYKISARSLRDNYNPNLPYQYIAFLNIKVTTSLAGISLKATTGTITIVNQELLKIILPEDTLKVMANLNITHNDQLLNKHIKPIDPRYTYSLIHNYRQSSTCISIPSNKENMGYINLDNCNLLFTTVTNLLVLVCAGCCSYVKTYKPGNKYTCPICYGLNHNMDITSQSTLIFCQQTFILDRIQNRKLLQLEIFNPVVIRLLFVDTPLEDYVTNERNLIEFIKASPEDFKVRYNTSIQQLNMNYNFNITLMISQNTTTPGQQVDVITIRKIKK
jgi:hypothetical protein